MKAWQMTGEFNHLGQPTINLEPVMILDEQQLEADLIEKLLGLKYEHRPDIRDHAALATNFRGKFQTLSHVKRTDGKSQSLLDEIVTPDVYSAARTLPTVTSFTRDDGTPLNYRLVNVKDRYRKTLKVVSRLASGVICA